MMWRLRYHLLWYAALMTALGWALALWEAWFLLGLVVGGNAGFLVGAVWSALEAVYVEEPWREKPAGSR
jgi:hypothetical protein